MGIATILLITVIILVVIVALQHYQIEVLLGDHDDLLQMISEVSGNAQAINDNAREVNDNARAVNRRTVEVIQHTKEMIAITKRVNDDNQKILKMLKEKENIK